MKGKFVQFALGVITGAALFGGVTAVAAGIVAEPSWSPIFVDGRQVQMTAYNILGNNFVKLRDIGKEVGFNVYYQDGVQVDSDAPYTGEAPASVSPIQPPSEPADTMMDARQEMIRLINQVRRENGVKELTENTALMEAAQEYSTHQYTTHHNQVECETVLAYGYPNGFGCNLTAFTGAAFSDVPQRAVQNWVNSPGHFQTMTDPDCDTVGIGITRADGWTFCCMFAGNPTAHNPYE